MHDSFGVHVLEAVEEAAHDLADLLSGEDVFALG